jgi:L-rhamnose mutarotase
MIRKAFSMKVKPGKIDEYEKSHNPIWGELYEILKAHGVYNYSIFYHNENDMLFGYLEIENELMFNSMANEKKCREWWSYMKNFLVSDSEDSPKAREKELREVFHID